MKNTPPPAQTKVNLTPEVVDAIAEMQSTGDLFVDMLEAWEEYLLDNSDDGIAEEAAISLGFIKNVRSIRKAILPFYAHKNQDV